MDLITLCLWCNGNAEEMATCYVELFPGSAITAVSRYGSGAPFPPGTALMVAFELAGRRFQALNGGPQHVPTPAMSLSVACRDAAEVDRYWAGLTANGGVEGRCGWLTDRFGVSWQIVPDGLGALLSDPDRGRAGRAMRAMMAMSKLDLEQMRAAADAAS